MQHISEHLKSIQQKSTTTTPWQSMSDTMAQQANPQLVKTLLEMFTMWKLQFKTKMTQGAWDLQTAQLWAIALADLEITEAMFATAYRKCLTLKWMPTTPADFAELAFANEIYPDCRQAYLDATGSRYSHEVVYETANRVGFYEIRTKSENEIFGVWSKTYTKVCAEHAKGARFSLPQAQQIEQKQETQNIISAEMQNEINRFLTTFGRKKHGQQGVKV